MKKACMSNVKDAENRSKKSCVCGGHSRKAKNAKKNKFRRNQLAAHFAILDEQKKYADRY